MIGLVMFGVALDLKWADFKRVFVSSEGRFGNKGPLIGLFAQFILLPAITFFLTLVIRPHPSMALGMMLVAACPGGNISNFMTHLAKGNTALSVSMTAVSTAAAIVMTPLNLSFWGHLNPDTVQILHEVNLDPLAVFKTILIILGIPLCLGMLLSYKLPKLAAKLKRPFRTGSIIFFLIFVAVAFSANLDHFVQCIGLVVLIVLLHNAMAISLGYGISRLARLPEKDVRAVSIEVGIQNAGLGLILVFQFFPGLGGMALIVAWWAIWHIISGLCMGFFWSRRDLR